MQRKSAGVSEITRRRLLSCGAGTLVAGLVAGRSDRAFATSGLSDHDLGSPQTFSFEILQQQAKALAAKGFKPVVPPSPEVLAEIDYDQYQRIRYRPDRSVRLGRDGHDPIQFFHLGKYAKDPVRMFVVENGSAREVLYAADLFDIPPKHPARKLSNGAGFAGFRIMADDLKTDWFAAMGASYFRTSGPFDQYGLSARGLAIDTAMPKSEEFPRFVAYWLEGAETPAHPVTIYALLDSPSLAGAYKMETRRTTNSQGVHRIVMEIDARLFVRKDIGRVGIAPFSSMFWYGEANRKKALDWRPEIHDNDGLAILTGSGERIWRPINNPPRVMTSMFVDNNVQGFGLLQRDRNFDHYLDDGIFYDRRSSVWVEPIDPWGEGAVQLVEIPTTTETDDNIVACWVPKQTFKGNDERTFRYRLSWLDDIAFPETLARTIGTWTGLGGRPGFDHVKGIQKYVVDFEGAVFHGLERDDGVDLVVNASRGKVSNNYCHPVVGETNRWRALFDIEAQGAEPVDLRAYLRKGDHALTETWIYQYFPSEP